MAAISTVATMGQIGAQRRATGSSATTSTIRPSLRVATVRPAAARRVVAVRASANEEQKQVITAACGVTTAATTLLSAGHANAAMEVVQLAGVDGRVGALVALLIPALGWVLYNIAGPALNQFNEMGSKNKAVAAGLGLSAASLVIADQADAAQEVAQLAGVDGRVGALVALLIPALGWVLYNIAGPALNQFNEMGEKNKAVAAGLGLSAASLAIADQADAAQEVAQLAGVDGRVGALVALLIPALGWVLYNIAGPALNQFNEMGEKNK